MPHIRSTRMQTPSRRVGVGPQRWGRPSGRARKSANETLKPRATSLGSPIVARIPAQRDRQRDITVFPASPDLAFANIAGLS